MDVFESICSRLPPNWWWAVYPPDCQDSEFLFNLRSFPLSFEFMKAALPEGGLICWGRSIKKAEFNTRFAGRLELADCRRLGEKNILPQGVPWRNFTSTGKPDTGSSEDSSASGAYGPARLFQDTS